MISIYFLLPLLLIKYFLNFEKSFMNRSAAAYY